jgi:hypothetical protein
MRDWMRSREGWRRHNGKDVRGQNTEFRILMKALNSEFCILTSDVFAVCLSVLSNDSFP